MEYALVFTAATLCLSGCHFISSGCGTYEILQVVKLEVTVGFYCHSIDYHNNEVLQCIKSFYFFGGFYMTFSYRPQKTHYRICEGWEFVPPMCYELQSDAFRNASLHKSEPV